MTTLSDDNAKGAYYYYYYTGQYYTPRAVVDYILNEVGYKPACGSGAFLVAALQVALDTRRQAITEEDPAP